MIRETFFYTGLGSAGWVIGVPGLCLVRRFDPIWIIRYHSTHQLEGDGLSFLDVHNRELVTGIDLIAFEIVHRLWKGFASLVLANFVLPRYKAQYDSVL